MLIIPIESIAKKYSKMCPATVELDASFEKRYTLTQSTVSRPRTSLPSDLSTPSLYTRWFASLCGKATLAFAACDTLSHPLVSNGLLDGNGKTTIYGTCVGHARSFATCPFDSYSFMVLHNPHLCPLSPPPVHVTRSRDPDAPVSSQLG